MDKCKLEILHARVSHARVWPKRNSFSYQVFYTKVKVQKSLDYQVPKGFSFNKWNLLSHFTQDFGARTAKTSWHSFIRGQLQKAGIPFSNQYSVYLISHPRVFGYSFNPISYWLIEDEHSNLRAVLCEVHNTFGETHNYLLAKPDNSPISPKDVFIAPKHLYVSPFNKNDGYYEFLFVHTRSKFSSVIRYFGSDGTHILTASVNGNTETLTTSSILKAIVLHPAMTLFVVLRIHWQALILFFKKIQPTVGERQEKYINDQTTVSQKLK